MNTSSDDMQSCHTGAVAAFEYPDISLMALPQSWQPEVETPEKEIPVQPSPEDCQRAEAELQGRIAQARAEGLRAGMEQAKAASDEALARERARIGAALEEFKKERVQYYSEVESELVQLALAIASKILHREAQIDPLLMSGLVRVAMQKLEQGSKVTVRVRPEEVKAWERNLSAQTDMSNIAIVADASVQPQDCVLETEVGTVQLGVEAQLKEVEQGFFDLLAHRPE